MKSGSDVGRYAAYAGAISSFLVSYQATNALWFSINWLSCPAPWSASDAIGRFLAAGGFGLGRDAVTTCATAVEASGEGPISARYRAL
jgi:hypothetical protein